jgi:glycerol-3-phosphate dehydrogenase
MIAVLGAGTMGAALATHLARAGAPPTLFATDRDRAAVKAWRDKQRHPGLGVVLHPAVVIRDLATARSARFDARFGVTVVMVALP